MKLDEHEEVTDEELKEHSVKTDEWKSLPFDMKITKTEPKTEHLIDAGTTRVVVIKGLDWKEQLRLTYNIKLQITKKHTDQCRHLGIDVKTPNGVKSLPHVTNVDNFSFPTLLTF